LPAHVVLCFYLQKLRFRSAANLWGRGLPELRDWHASEVLSPRSFQGIARAKRMPDGTASDAPGVSGHEVHETIGIGGMGSIHRARQGSLQRDVALKISVPHRTSPEDRDRFLREARVLAQLDHPNIVPIYDFGRDDEGRCYYTMKMVRGRTLKAIITAVRDGAEIWTLERLLEVFRKTCDAVAFAHARGVIHRDLKPENIMVGEFGEVLVMDWGLAGQIKTVVEYPATKVRGTSGATGENRPQAIDSAVELTLEGEVVGTPQYMSPEQACARTDLDERSDVYALGGILHSILTLRPPVKKGEIDEMLESVRTGRIEPFDSRPPSPQPSRAPWRIPAPLAAVVRKAMALDREDRFQAVSELADDVDAHLAGYATSAEDINFAGQFWLFIKRHVTVTIAVLVLLVVSAGFFFQLLASERRATFNARVAGHNESVARKSEEAARKSEDSARNALAKSQIALADSAYVAGDTAQMRALLDIVPADQRETNWDYLNVRTDDRQALIKRGEDGFLVGAVPVPNRPGIFTAATSGDYHRIVDFDGKSGKILREWTQRIGWVRGIAYSPDGSLIALARIMGDGVSIHRAADGEELLSWKSGWADAVDFLPDGKRLLQSDQHSCYMYDVATGRRLWTSNEGMVHLLTPDATRIATLDETVLSVISAEDGRLLATYKLKPSTPIGASLSPDGTTVLIPHQDGQIAAYRIADGSRIYETPAGENGAILRSAYTPDGRWIVTVANLLESVQSVQIRDAATGRVLRSLRGGAGGIETLCIHPLSRDVLITSGTSATWALPKIHEPRWTVARREFTSGYHDGLIGGFVGGDDQFIAPGPKAPIGVIDLASGGVVWLPEVDGMNAAIASEDGRLGMIQSGGHDSRRFYTVFRAEAGRIEPVSMIDFGTDARALAFNCDGTRAALSGAWGGIDTFRVSDGQKLAILDQDDIRSTYSLLWHPTDPTRLIGIFTIGGRRGMKEAENWLISWNSDTGERSKSVRSEVPMNRLAVEPGGTRFAEVGEDKMVRIRDVNTLKVIKEFRAHDGPIQAIAWRPGTHIIATGSTDRSVRLWDVDSGQFIEELHIGLREIARPVFQPFGQPSCLFQSWREDVDLGFAGKPRHFEIEGLLASLRRCSLVARPQRAARVCCI
jgi:serine/threonine protein kinase/WD40 repeat protein